MMRKKLSTYLFLLLPFLSCSTNENVETPALAESEDVTIKNGNSLLWKIESENTKPAYIFGTMHMINAEFYNFSDGLKKRVAAADEIIMEVNGMANPIAAYEMMLLDSGTVHHYFNAEQLVELLEFMDTRMGISPQEFDQTYGQMKPFYLMQTITQGYFEADAKSYDLEIMGIAGASDIPIYGLETIEEQLSLFDSIPKSEMAEMIITGIRDYDKETKDTEKLMELYSKQKVDKLIPLLQKQSPEFMQFDDIFLYNRNKAWIPQLEEEMTSKHCFIAVGAGHLFGDEGVLDLLEKKGYTITAISTE